MKRPRSDAKLLNLPEEQKAQLCDWLLSGIPYHRIKAMLKEAPFSLSISLSSLSDFYQQFCSAELIARRQRAVSTADEIAVEVSKQPGKFDAATIDALKQKAFELSINPGADPRDVKSLFMLVLKARDQELQEKDVDIKLRRLELLEKNAAQAKDALTTLASKGGITPETRTQIEEALNLL